MIIQGDNAVEGEVKVRGGNGGEEEVMVQGLLEYKQKKH